MRQRCAQKRVNMSGSKLFKQVVGFFPQKWMSSASKSGSSSNKLTETQKNLRQELEYYEYEGGYPNEVATEAQIYYLVCLADSLDMSMSELAQLAEYSYGIRNVGESYDSLTRREAGFLIDALKDLID